MKGHFQQEEAAIWAAASKRQPRENETKAEKAEREYPDWRGTYRLDYTRDEDTGRIKELRLHTVGGELFGNDDIVVSATPDGFLYIGEPDDD